MREIAVELRQKGRHVYMVSFQNSVACKNGGSTIHKFVKMLRRGEVQTPCTILWDEVFYCNRYTLARMVPYRMLPSCQWLYFGDAGQPQIGGHWRGVRCTKEIGKDPLSWILVVQKEDEIS